MILEKQKESVIYQDGEAAQESIGMSLDLDSAQILMQMLSKNLYSDPIGSTIRECASNALDSHRRAGVDKPIVVSLYITKDSTYEFSVEDFGIGLDADDVKNIISKYGKSTKRSSATELGMMGLGFKAPLAYTSTFYFVCRKDGMERKYMMYEGEDVNTIDLLYETPTDQPNGVKVIVPVIYSDRHQFISKIKEQLGYFESVFFNVEGVDNNFVIVRHEHFQFSSLVNHSDLHICLDNVYYPIDFKKLGIDRIYLPVGLRFSLTDGIFPTPNRESIRYTEEAKQVILNRLVEAANHLISKYNTTVDDSDDIASIYEYYARNEVTLDTENLKMKLNDILKYATIVVKKPKLKGINLLDIERFFNKLSGYALDEYHIKHIITSKTIRDAKHKSLSFAMMVGSKQAVYFKDGGVKMSGPLKSYLRSTITGSRWDERYIVMRKKTFPLFSKKGDDSYNSYYNILKLKNYPKNQWRTVIQEFQKIVSMITDKWVNISTIEVPDAFIPKKAVQLTSSQGAIAKPRQIRLEGELIVKKACDLERWVDGKHCKWVSERLKGPEVHKIPKLIVYGSSADVEMMDKWYPITKGQDMMFISLSDRELKLVSKINLHNLIPFSKFMEGNNKPFRRLATYCLIAELMERYDSSFNHMKNIKQVSAHLGDIMQELHDYRLKNRKHVEKDVRKMILEHAKAVNMFDEEIMHKYKYVEFVLNKFPFIEVLCDRFSSYREDLIPILIDLFKYNKYRINWQNYKTIKLNEDLPLEETLTTETVEELTND
jgi:hypothetical protein